MIKTVFDIKFIFGMCHRSWAAETHGKCKHDWNYLNYTFAKSTFSVTENLANGALITPTQTCLYACAITKLSITISCDRCPTRHPWVRFGTSPLTTNTNTTNLYPTTVPEIKLYDYVMIWMRFPHLQLCEWNPGFTCHLVSVNMVCCQEQIHSEIGQTHARQKRHYDFLK